MSFHLIKEEHILKLNTIINKLVSKPDLYDLIVDLSALIDKIYNDIPENKRISSGKYSVIKELGIELSEKLEAAGLPVSEIAIKIFTDNNLDYLIRGLALQLITIYGLDDPDKAWPYILEAASSENWFLREFVSGFVRKMIAKYPEEIKIQFLKILEESDDENLRRFVSESLRPVADNHWFLQNPEYQLSIIRKMFNEKYKYSRTSVGNSLSDWARTYPEMVYGIIEELVNSGDENSYWIAYRACRNLVKKEPLRVMDLLKVDEYKYKTRIHYRKDYK